ncbi:Mitochondrial nuclease [Ceratocystis lukuohia]|uniref:Endonuclease n=2 Tax=Ceratocystis TaxID=5157 RepID=A0A0F8B3X4_CERFI|nr:Mitochondrial nuclease [Ceratocystis platani]
MSKSSFALMAALGAGGGAAATAALFSMRSDAHEAAPFKSIPVPGPVTASPSMIVSPGGAHGSAVMPPLAGAGAGAGSAVVAGSDSAVGGLSPVNPAGIFDYGFTGCVSDVAIRSALASGFDRERRNPAWVAEHITRESLAQRGGDRKNSTFVEDTDIPSKFRALLRDYYRSGFDRGHQVPAADCKWGQAAMDDTFFLSNMCPQVGDGFNRDYWAHFEDFCRRLTHKYPSVRVVTGPLYLPKREADGKWYVKYEVIGSPPNVAVPTHFYKVIYAEDGRDGGNVAIGAFVLPNAVIPNHKPLRDFEVPLEAVERASGLEFAEKLPVQRRRRLCTDADCSLVIKEYAKQQQVFTKK